MSRFLRNVPHGPARRRRRRWTAVLVGLAAAYALISFLLAFGLTRAERKPLEHDPAEFGARYQNVTFPSRGDEVTLSGWFLPAQGESAAGAGRTGEAAADSAAPAVIFVHGIDANRELDGALELCVMLARRGFDVLSFDLRAHGASGGGRVTGGQEERFDVLGAVDWMKERASRASHVPGALPAADAAAAAAKPVGLLGFSMGAVVSLLAAVEEPSVRAVVADSPFADVRDMIAPEAARESPLPEAIIPLFVPGMSFVARNLLGIRLDAIVAEDAVRRIDYPVFVIHGTGDTRIPNRQGVRVHQASGDGEEYLWLVPGVDHVDAFTEHKTEYVDRVERYFRERLGQ